MKILVNVSKNKPLMCVSKKIELFCIILPLIFTSVFLFTSCRPKSSPTGDVSGSIISGISSSTASDMSSTIESGISVNSQSEKSSNIKSDTANSNKSDISSNTDSSISENIASGIKGQVMIGPIHPVEIISEPNEKPYPDAIIIIRNKNDGSEIKRVSVDKNGIFKIPLQAGVYILEAKNKYGNVMPASKTMEIRITSNKYTNVTIELDSGIR